MGERTAQTVKPPDHEHIAGRQSGQGLHQARSGHRLAGDAIVLEHTLTADAGQRVALQGEVLLVGGHTGVANSHARISPNPFARRK